MSVNYSAGLSHYEEKGVCGLPEIVEDSEKIEEKIKVVCEWIKSSKCVVIHCGAGISTSCGIPDFRGPKGVWTLEKAKEDEERRKNKQNSIRRSKDCKAFALKKETGDDKEPENQSSDLLLESTPIGQSISFEASKPSYTHRALNQLASSGLIHFIISQNVDGLFLKTGINRRFICELHGNFFLDECDTCESRFIRSTSSPTMGLKVSTRSCPRPGRPCRGHLRDTILDWEDDLPVGELEMAQQFAAKADLCICLGTSLQIVPAANLPFVCKKRKSDQGKVIIINLQPTKFDHKADLVLHDYVDSVLERICKQLNISVPDYDPAHDLTKLVETNNQLNLWK